MFKKIGVATLAVFTVAFVGACVNAKYQDPTDESDAYTPRYSAPVPSSQLNKMTSADVDTLKNGGSVTKSPATSIIYQICPSCCLTCQYETPEPPSTEEVASFNDTNACVSDVEGQFNAVNTTGNKLEAYASIDYIHPDRYTEKVDNLFGLQNHIQGFKRLRKPGYFAVVGGDPPRNAVLNQYVPDFLASALYAIIDTKNRSASDLWIVRIDSKVSAGSGPMGSNLDFGPWNYPHPWDTIVLPIEIEKGNFWHPGGIDTLGDILAIPIQAYLVTDPEQSKTVFFYVGNPENPMKFDFEINIGGSYATMDKLSNGRYLLVVDGKYMLSNSTNFADGFDTSNVLSGAPGGSQAHIITQCDGQKYMMTFGNTGSAAPTFSNGTDEATLYKLDYTSSGILDSSPSLNAAPVTTQVAKRNFSCYSGGKYCNFDAAGGTYVDPATNKMSLYGIYHFRTSDERLKMREFN